MFRHCAIAMAAFLIGGTVFAESFAARIEKANALVRDSQPAKALEIYQELLTDHPQSEVLLYDMGCAYAEDAMAQAEAGSTDGFVNAMTQARATFERAVSVGKGSIREKAAFNGANALAQMADTLRTAEKPDEAVRGYEAAAEAYEAVLREYPGNEGARRNLDYVRYQLKLMQQNPPEQKKDEQQKEPPKDQPQVRIEIQADTDLPDAMVQTSQDKSSATARLVPRTEEQTP